MFFCFFCFGGDFSTHLPPTIASLLVLLLLPSSSLPLAPRQRYFNFHGFGLERVLRARRPCVEQQRPTIIVNRIEATCPCIKCPGASAASSVPVLARAAVHEWKVDLSDAQRRAQSPPKAPVASPESRGEALVDVVVERGIHSECPRHDSGPAPALSFESGRVPSRRCAFAHL